MLLRYQGIAGEDEGIWHYRLPDGTGFAPLGKAAAVGADADTDTGFIAAALAD